MVTKNYWRAGLDQLGPTPSSIKPFNPNADRYRRHKGDPGVSIQTIWKAHGTRNNKRRKITLPHFKFEETKMMADDFSGMTFENGAIDPAEAEAIQSKFRANSAYAKGHRKLELMRLLIQKADELRAAQRASVLDPGNDDKKQGAVDSARDYDLLRIEYDAFLTGE